MQEPTNACAAPAFSTFSLSPVGRQDILKYKYTGVPGGTRESVFEPAVLGLDFRFLE